MIYLYLFIIASAAGIAYGSQQERIDRAVLALLTALKPHKLRIRVATLVAVATFVSYVWLVDGTAALIEVASESALTLSAVGVGVVMTAIWVSFGGMPGTKAAKQWRKRQRQFDRDRYNRHFKESGFS